MEIAPNRKKQPPLDRHGFFSFFDFTQTFIRHVVYGRGRNASYPAPPAQIPASGTTALGSYLG